MGNSSNDDYITLRVQYPYRWCDKFTSVFIKREGRDPTEIDWSREMERMRAAYEEDVELARKRLLEESGIEPDPGDVYKAFTTRLNDPEHNSE